MAVQSPKVSGSPPVLPYISGIDNSLVNYLKNFSVWARDSLGDKVDGNTALPHNLLQSYDTPRGSTPNVFKLQINAAGVASLAQVPLGNPAKPDAPGTGIPLVNEAPTDGQSYARQSSGWTAVVSAGGGTMTGNLTAPNITATGALTAALVGFSTLPVNAANDAAAATAGVPIGGVYRNGSVLMVRTV
jgi:hypothetical protein